MMLLSRARRGANGKAATKMVMKPNWRTEEGGGKKRRSEEEEEEEEEGSGCGRFLNILWWASVEVLCRTQ